MEPHLTGKQYDKIASWWHDYHKTSSYGVKPFEHALSFVSAKREERQTAPLALDVGCGSSDRFISILERSGFLLTGIDVSEKMIKLAKDNHPSHHFCMMILALGNQTTSMIIFMLGIAYFIFR
ncbi:methyltransferase domain-containing protein [Alteromonas sp. MB-3u-76]|uniref:methyltransferase domain-containing protein n=1 Tax=Alteromonas sp. MB-3u-76 TaxID=2058133 RepID=UPI0018E2042A|nr:methyltransferase domain-containing protein [Alteromonas sp. MB-3u-76]